MSNSNSNFKIIMGVGESATFPANSFINLQLWASSGCFKIENLTRDFTNKITTDASIVEASDYISADGTDPDSATNTPDHIKFIDTPNESIKATCMVAGKLSVILES